MSKDIGKEYMRALGKSARKTLEDLADDLNIHGQLRKDMMKISPIHISGSGFHDVYGEESNV